MNDSEFEDWVIDQRNNVKKYLESQGVNNPNIGEWPAFEVAPYFAIWVVESQISPGNIGWWSFSGDCPTDYISGKDINHPRIALEKLLTNWKNYTKYMHQNTQPPNTNFGDGANLQELAELLDKRISILSEWVADDSLWNDL